MDAEERRYQKLFEILPCRSVVVSLTRCISKRKEGPTWTNTDIWIPQQGGVLPSPLTSPPSETSRSSSVQFFGVHSCFVATLVRPAIVDNILRISECLPSVPTLGPITWMGKAPMQQTNSNKLIRTPTPGWRLRLKTSLWTPPGDMFTTRTRAAMLIFHQRSAVSSAEFMLMMIPAISRKLFDRPLID